MILSQEEIGVLLLSLKIASVSILSILPVSIFFAWILAKYQFFGKSILDAFVHLPLVLPPVALGYLLLLTMGRKGIIGQWLYHYFNIEFIFNWKGAALVSSIVALPLVVRSLRLAFESIDPRLESVARTLGASKQKVFLSVILPLAFPGLLTGVVLGFARCLGEFGATITFASNIEGETRTIPLDMYTLMQNPATDEIDLLKLCFLSVSLSIIALIISESLNQWHKRKLKG